MLSPDKNTLLLDMNGTFMFGEDRFGDSENFSIHYNRLGGALRPTMVNQIIREAYNYLDKRYTDESYQNCFPSVKSAIFEVSDKSLDASEINRLTEVFSHHELGQIPDAFVEVLQKLHRDFTLAAVIDIWAPKPPWLNAFQNTGTDKLFSATSFSSDHGMVKPSPKPFELVLRQLGKKRSEAVVIGDSVRRDLGGAKNADIDCILVGGARHPYALRNFKDLLEFYSEIA